MTKKEFLKNLDFFCSGYYSGLFDNNFMDMNLSINNYLSKYQITRFNNPKAKINKEEIKNLKNASENLSDDKYLKYYQNLGRTFGMKLRNSLSDSQIKSLPKINNILIFESTYGDGAIKKYFSKELLNNDVKQSIINAHKNLFNYLKESARVK